MKRAIIAILMMLVAANLYGQGGRYIYGCVYDDNQTPLGGVVISSPDGGVICTTGDNGQFEGSSKSFITSIVASLDGYKTISVKIDGSFEIIKLSKEAQPKRTPQVHAEELGVWKQSLSLNAGILVGLEYSVSRRYNNYLSYGANIMIGQRFEPDDVTFKISAFGKIDLFNETLKNSPLKPYFATSLGVLLPSYEYEYEYEYEDWSGNYTEQQYWSHPFIIVPELGVDWYIDNEGKKIVYASLNYTYKTRHEKYWYKGELESHYERTDALIWLKIGYKF